MSSSSRSRSTSLLSAATTLGRNTSDHGVPLQLRDLRVLLWLSEPTLLVRRGVMALSFGHIRALVTARRALFILTDNDPSPVSDLRNKMDEEPQDNAVKLPFELRVLEEVLLLSLRTSALSVDECMRESEWLLRALGKSITPELLNRAYMLKGQVSRALQELKRAQVEIERVQRDDSLMALINLFDLFHDTDTLVSIYACIYVYIYVCLFVCLYACMFVCMYITCI